MDRFTCMLAPLEDITGNAFRTICYQYGADLTFTEMARVESLVENNASTWQKLAHHDTTPTVIQLYGQKEQYYIEFLKRFQPYEGFMGFNLNLGCPSPQLVRLGLGCAMMKRVEKNQRIMRIFHDSGWKISIKMRLGLNQREKENKAYLNLIEGVDADFFIVHPRHGMQTYVQPPDNDIYEECVKTGKMIIANGDITTIEQVDHLKSIGVKGAMIGRAAVKDPSIFSRLKSGTDQDKESALSRFLQLSQRYDEKEKYRQNILKFTQCTTKKMS